MSDDRSNALAIAVLWLTLVVGMMLHFNYDVSGLRYGVNIQLPNATGAVPWSNFVIKALFYVVPLLLAVVATSFPGRGYRPFHFVLTVLFLLANISHLVTTARHATEVIGYAQVLLLLSVLLANAQLSRVSYRWWRAA